MVQLSNDMKKRKSHVAWFINSNNLLYYYLLTCFISEILPIWNLQLLRLFVPKYEHDVLLEIMYDTVSFLKEKKSFYLVLLIKICAHVDA